MSQTAVAKIRLCLGQCYRHQGNFSRANKHFQNALNALGQHEEPEYVRVRQEAMRGLNQCHDSSTEASASIAKSLWKCFYPKPPELKPESHARTMEEDEFCSLLAGNGILQLKNAGPDAGWTLAVTRDVGPGKNLSST